MTSVGHLHELGAQHCRNRFDELLIIHPHPQRDGIADYMTARWTAVEIEEASNTVASADFVGALSSGEVREPPFVELAAIALVVGFSMDSWYARQPWEPSFPWPGRFVKLLGEYPHPGRVLIEDGTQNPWSIDEIVAERSRRSSRTDWAGSSQESEFRRFLMSLMDDNTIRSSNPETWTPYRRHPEAGHLKWTSRIVGFPVEALGLGYDPAAPELAENYI